MKLNRAPSVIISSNLVSVWTFVLQFKDTTAAMPSELETAMESLIKVFHRYASRDGRSGTLSRRELRELMENELSNFLKVRKDRNIKFKNYKFVLRSSHSFFDPVSEGPCCCRQNHEGPGHQRRWPGGLRGVCFSGCWTVHCLRAVLSDAHEEDVKEVKTWQRKRLEESQKSISR